MSTKTMQTDYGDKSLGCCVLDLHALSTALKENI